mgnify:FL=1
MKKWQKVKKYIANWKDIKKNMTKTDSIKKWLILLAGLQIFLTMAFLCYLVTVSAYQNYNMATHRYFQIGEQLLDRVEISVKELEQATFFPAQLYAQNNDPYLCSTLREGPSLKIFVFIRILILRPRTVSQQNLPVLLLFMILKEMAYILQKEQIMALAF